MRGSRRLFVLASTLLAFLILTGCAQRGERVKLRDLEFTVLSEEKIPGELKTIIEEKKAEAFRITYTDREHLYIVVGYGEQTTGGYSIAVNDLYLTEDCVYVKTLLLGPENGNGAAVLTYPYIVIKTELREEPVVME